MAESANSRSLRVEQRMEFIEFRLFWDGQIRRGDLRKRFEVSIPQASADLNAYQKIAPGNLVYDIKRSAYVPTDEFKPVIYEPDARDYLTELRLIGDRVVTPDLSKLGFLPPFDAVPLLRRRASEARLRRVIRGIRLGNAVYIRYQSITREEPIWRWITPHALAFDGFRWHVRAWCHRNNAFRDFVVARTLEVDREKEHKIDIHADREWQEFVTLRLGPNPKLSKAAQRGIELDYGMTDGIVELTSRICLLWYLERYYGLDLDADAVGPNRQQIVLRNRSEVDRKRESVKKAAEKAAAALATA